MEEARVPGYPPDEEGQETSGLDQIPQGLLAPSQDVKHGSPFSA